MEFSNGEVLLIQTILGLMTGILAVLAWVGKQILTEVRKTNGRLTAVEVTLLTHDRMDTVRFDELEKRLDREKK